MQRVSKRQQAVLDVLDEEIRELQEKLEKMRASQGAEVA